MNDIARVKLRTTAPLFIDKYNRNRQTGSLILIDETTKIKINAAKYNICYE